MSISSAIPPIPQRSINLQNSKTPVPTQYLPPAIFLDYTYSDFFLLRPLSSPLNRRHVRCMHERLLGKYIVYAIVINDLECSLYEQKQAPSIQPQTTITPKLRCRRQTTITTPKKISSPPHLIHRPHHLNPPLPPTPHPHARLPPTKTPKLTFSARGIDALGRLLDGVAGAFLVDDGFALEDGGGGGAVVAAVAVGDLFAHVADGGWSLGLKSGSVFC